MKVELGEIKEESREEKRRTVWKIAAVVLAVLLAAGGGFAAAKSRYENMKIVERVEVPVEKETFVDRIVETKTEITAEMMQEKLRDIGELATEEYTYTEVGTFDRSKTVQILGRDYNLPLTQSKFIYSYDGTIKAGIDFTQITVEKDEAGRQITVTLPAARILSSELDEDSFQLYDEKNNIFNPYSVSDVNDTNREIKTHAEEKAVSKGLLKRAGENAKTMIYGLLRSAYVEALDIGEYTIQVRTA